MANSSSSPSSHTRAAEDSGGRPKRVAQVSQELIKGTVVPVVLALLKDGPRYGYEMVQSVNARTNGALDWSEGTLYPVLHKLEADGLVSAEWREAGATKGGGRRRRYYALTGAGRRELKRRSSEWQTFATAMGEFFRGLGKSFSIHHSIMPGGVS